MFEDILTTIPCRAGSQRFPGKNTALFKGVPLVVNTIKIALDAGLTNIIVSTDDVDVINLCKEMKIKFITRPAELCNSHAKSEDVILHAASQAHESDTEFKSICLMQVTSPLLEASSLNTALKQYTSNELPSLTAVDNRYQPVGAFYIVNADLFVGNKSLYQSGGGLYKLPPEQCMDVDHQYQLSICEIIAAGNARGL